MTVSLGPRTRRVAEAVRRFFRPAAEPGEADVETPRKEAPAPGAPTSDARGPGKAGDSFADDKERLRRLSSWIVVTAGSVAAVLIVGSQLSDLGQLDFSQKVSLFGIKRNRFDFAVIGFATALGSAAFVIAAAVWIQISGHVTLKELSSFPVARRPRILGWRVRAKVREAVDFDLMKRRGITVPDLIDEWGMAKAKVARLRRSKNCLTETLAGARLMPPGSPAIPWESEDELSDVARVVVASRPRAASADVEDRISHIEAATASVLASARDQAEGWVELMKLVLDDASYLRMRLSFGMALKYMVFATFLGGLGIATFAWATNPPVPVALGQIERVIDTRASDSAGAITAFGGVFARFPEAERAFRPSES